MRGRGWLVAALVAMVAAPVAAIDWSQLTFNGYTSMEFERQLERKGSGNGDSNGSFDFDGFDLIMNFQAHPRVRAMVDLTWEHGVMSESSQGNIGVEQGFIEYAYSDMLKIRFGKMFTPFGYFNEIHTAKPAFLSVKEAPSLNKTERIVGDAFRFYPRWGTGIQFVGDGEIAGKRWDYSVLISNGEQENTNPFEEDDNKSKAVTGRVRFEPTDELRVGLSVYRDKFSGGDWDYLQSAGFEMEYWQGPFRLLAEVAVGRLQAAETFDGDSRTQVGFYLMPSYHFENGVTPYARFDWVDPNRHVGSDRGHVLTVGINWEISHWFMLKVENNTFKGQKGTSLAEYPGGDYNEIKSAIVLGF